MTEDELAAVVAAARVLFARAATEPAAAPSPRWMLAGRIALADAAQAPLAALSRSRWMLRGRLRG